MSEVMIEFLKQVNVVQLAAILVMFWFFYNRLDQKIDKLSDKVEDVDRRLCRIEGSLSSHGHCLFNQTQPDRKAE